MRRLEDTMIPRIVTMAAFAVLIAMCLPLAPVMAETVEVSPGVQVT